MFILKRPLATAPAIACLLLLMAAPATVQAQFGYSINPGGTTITITNYSGPGGAVTIPTNIDGLTVVSIGNSAFYNMTNLTSVTIPGGVTNIGREAFGFTSLASIMIPNSVTSIGDYAFTFCSSLTSITIGKNVTSIGLDPFDGCAGLTAITIAAQNSFYSTLKGVLFDKSQSTLLEYPGGVGGSYAIPNSVTSVGYGAFEDSSVTSVTIPSSVTSIGATAFNQSLSLTSVIIPAGVTNIGDSAFDFCYRMTNLTIANGITSIGFNAFAYCSGLTSVTIPASVTNLEDLAFEGCTSLTSMYFKSNAPSADCTVFENGTGNASEFDPVTVYYLPGTTGWGSTFACVPTAPRNAPSGSLQVTILPAGVVGNGAQWQVDGGVFQPSGATVLGLSAGNHMLSFSVVSAWTTPPNQIVTVQANKTNTASGYYTGNSLVIITQPTSPPQTPAGLSATFTVVVSGAAPLNYQWQRNNAPLSTSGDFSGVNSPTLTIDPVALADAGSYSVKISNSYGSTNSSTAVLSVLVDTNDAENFSAGTNYIADGDFAMADQSLSVAVALSPTNAAYNFFYAAAELFSLPEEPAGSNFLSHLGLGDTGRDIFNWQARPQTNSKGHLIIPSTDPLLNVDEFTAQLRTNVLYAIINAQNNLAQITDTNFTVYLSTNETHAGAVTVDWGDVQMLQAMCDTAELFIYTTYSWNLDVQFNRATNYLGKDGSIEEFLTNYPYLLTTTSTNDLPAAKVAFTNAINEYFAASAFIRNSNRMAETRLFNLSTNKTQEELQFRQTLSNLLASLDGPPVALTVSSNYSISAAAFFDGSFSPGSYLPEFEGNKFLWDTFPDTTFGGIISGLNEPQVDKGFLKKFHSEGILNLPDTSLSVLYNFTNFSDQTGVVQGADGNFYGTLTTGGPYTFSDQNFGVGYGSVLKITSSGKFTTLYNFGAQQDESGNPLDGAYPNAVIFGSDGNIYGTTMSGGLNGEGTVFKITTSGHLTTLHDFGDETDQQSSTPVAALVQGNDGRLYGTTMNGGGVKGSAAGTVFAIATNGAYTFLNSFVSTIETNIYYAVIKSPPSVTTTTNRVTVFFNGGNPAAPLVQGSDGNFYGTTPVGGGVTSIYSNYAIHSIVTNFFNGYGTIFKVIPSSGQITTFYTFGTQQGAYGSPLDGAVPNGLIQGPDGNLYGTTEYGGSNDDYEAGPWAGFGVYGGSGSGDGTLFRISPTNTNSFASLLSFDENFSDGYSPIGSLILGPQGSFYGLASAGGVNKRGALFNFNTNGAATNLVWLNKSSGSYGGHLQSFVYFQSFSIGPSTVVPVPSFLTQGLDGNLYGTTTDDGTNGNGTVYIFNITNYGSLEVALTSPGNGRFFTAPANITLDATVTSATSNTAVLFYNETTLLGSATAAPYSILLSNLTAGSYAFSAVATNTGGISVTSRVAYVTVTLGGTIDFDSLDAGGSAAVTGTTLANYLAEFGATVTNNSPGTVVAVENETNVAGGGFVIASSPSNILTQIGSAGPVSFTVGFANFLSQFSFTRPELLANPAVTHPAWVVQAFDPLGNLLDSVSAPQIYSTADVPAQTYTLTGGSIASVEFISQGTGLTTFNAILLDDFVLTAGGSEDLPPSVVINNPINGQVFASTEIPISAETASEFGTVSRVDFYTNGALAGSSSSSPFSITWNASTDGVYLLTAVAVNSFGLNATSAPIAVAVGFAIATQPLSQTIGVNNNATFSVVPSTTNVSYQWLLNGTNLGGATHSSFTVSNASVSASGSYSVLVTSGSISITSAPALLTVLGPPIINSIAPGTNVPVSFGASFTLSVNASDPDSVPFYYQWQLNGNHIAGATNSSYTVTNARPFNSGNYQVVVANAAASVESSNINVAAGLGASTTTNDNFASSLTFDPFTSAVSGINSSSSVPPTDGPATIAGKPAAGFLWYNWKATFSGVISLTTRGSTFDTLLGVYTGSSLGTLTSVAEDDDSGGFFTSLVVFNCGAGTNYQIAVAGYHGAAGHAVLELSPGPADGFAGPANGFSIGGPVPVITQQPASQIVDAGDTVILTVMTTGAAGFQWYFADVPVTRGTNSTLSITNFPTNAVGNYYVQVSNSVGAVRSTNVTIEIATENKNITPATLLVDKFSDAVDLAGAPTPAHHRPQDGGGETGGYTLSQSFSTVDATKEAGEPNHAGQPGGASYWYSYTALVAGTLEFDTDGSAFNTILAVYIGPGDSFNTLTNVASAYTTNYMENGQPVVVITNATPNTKYFIAIDGYLGAWGDAYLNILLNPPTNALTYTSAITNNTPVVTISYPPDNYLALSSNINVRGTVKGSGGQIPTGTLVQISVNTHAFGQIIPQSERGESIWSTNMSLVPGANIITAQSISEEGTNTNTAFVSMPVTRTIFYDLTAPSPKIKGPVTLKTTGQGRIAGEHDQANLEIGKVYTVTAVPIGNWIFTNWMSGTNATNLTPLIGPAALAFDMCSNLILQANFVTNPFTAVAGVYNGLFSPASGVTEESSGFITATLTHSSRGAFSAKVLLDGGVYPFTGTFDLTGNAAKIVPRPGKTSLTVLLQLALSTNAQTTNLVTGSVSDITTNGWTSLLLADRAVFNAKSNPATNYDGRYTLIIPPGTNGPVLAPGGYGYITLSNNPAGQVSLSGRAGDGVTLSQSVPVSTNGNIPLYVSLYSRQGSLQGWLTLTNNPTNRPAQTILGTNLSCLKGFSHAGTMYPSGFTNTNIIVLGSHYAAAAGLDLTNVTLTISNSSPAYSLTYSNLTLSANKLGNQSASGNPSASLEGTVTPGTGLLTVTFRADGTETVARGVVLQENQTTNTIGSTNAAGWFLDGVHSGWFLLQQPQ